MMLQLGWKAGTEQFPPTELAEYAVGADTIKKLACVSPNPDDHIKFAQRYTGKDGYWSLWPPDICDGCPSFPGRGRDGQTADALSPCHRPGPRQGGGLGDQCCLASLAQRATQQSAGRDRAGVPRSRTPTGSTA